LKVLRDTCVWGPAKSEIQATGIDVWWTGELEEDPGDTEILAIAYREKRILVTIDNDFGELAVRRGLPHNGIVRLDEIPAHLQGKTILKVIADHYEVLIAGGIITAYTNRIRVRSGNRGD